MSDSIKISIITISYNEKNAIKNTILSVINQSYYNREYIVIDGGSSDGTLEIIKKYSSQIDVFVSEPDKGIYDAMNKGIDFATGDYCIFMNAGDVFVNDNVLTKVIPFLRSSFDIYNGFTYYIYRGRIKWYRRPPKKVDLSFFYSSSICHQSSFIKTSLLKKYHYDDQCKYVADGKFWTIVLGLNHGSYKAINIDISCFDTEGISNTQLSKSNIEKNLVMHKLLSKEQVDYCEKKKQRWNKSYNIKRRYEGLIRRLLLIYAIIFKKKKLKYINNIHHIK